MPIMTDFYEVLGVSRDADAATIRRAFRRKVRSTHPDGGGSVDAFNALKRAYDTLSDTARKRHYDETGDSSADPHWARVVEILSFGLDQALLQLNSAGSYRDVHVIEVMAKIVSDMKLNDEKQKQALEGAMQQAEQLAGRFRVTEGENLMETVIAKRIAACRAQLDVLDGRIRFVDAALDLLRKTSLESLLGLMNQMPAPSEPQHGIETGPSLLDLSSLVRFS
jgi:hypothetical protein